MPTVIKKFVPQAPVGIDDFFDLVNPQEPGLFVDRTLWIPQIFHEKAKVLAFHTFRRSGKSLTASMLECFFADHVGSFSTQDMFDRLKIGQEDPEFVDQHQGKYPVVAVTLKNAVGATFKDTVVKILELVRQCYLKHLYLETSDSLSPQEKKQFYHYTLEESIDQIPLSKWESSFLNLITWLEKHHRRRVFMIIDEYDAPLIAGSQQGFLSQMTAFLRELLGAALKSNHALEKGVLFGIVRFSKESFLSGLNNVQVYTLLQPGKYHPYFGFSKENVVSLLEQADISLDHLEEIRTWYNGYRVGPDELYNPLSVMSYIKEGVGCPRPFWVNTGNDELQRQLLNHASSTTQDQFRSFINEGKPIFVELSDVVKFEDILTDDSAFWALLYAAGYLTAVEPLKPIHTHYEGIVKIPNQEVRSLYIDVCQHWLKQECLAVIPGSSLKNFYQAVQEGNVDKLGRWLGDFLLTHTSHHNLTQESAYHILLLGLAAGLADSHFVWSESESGAGRPDLMLVPKSEKIAELAWIFEFKRLPKTPGRKTPTMRQKHLEELAQNAVEQITENRYTAKLTDFPYVKRVLKVGMAFGGKRVVWKAQEK